MIRLFCLIYISVIKLGQKIILFLVLLFKTCIENIDEKLEKFTEDEKEKEKDFSSSCDFNDQFIMEQALKRINEQFKTCISII